MACLDSHSSFCALVLNTDGSVDGFFDTPMGVEMGRVAALGSGLEFAMGAMYAGKSAKEAVEIACKLDNGSAKPVKTRKITA